MSQVCSIELAQRLMELKAWEGRADQDDDVYDLPGPGMIGGTFLPRLGDLVRRLAEARALAELDECLGEWRCTARGIGRWPYPMAEADTPEDAAAHVLCQVLEGKRDGK